MSAQERTQPLGALQIIKQFHFTGKEKDCKWIERNFLK